MEDLSSEIQMCVFDVIEDLTGPLQALGDLTVVRLS